MLLSCKNYSKKIFV